MQVVGRVAGRSKVYLSTPSRQRHEGTRNGMTVGPDVSRSPVGQMGLDLLIFSMAAFSPSSIETLYR